MATFSERFSDYVNRIIDHTLECKKDIKTRVLLDDTRFLPLDDESVDLIVTSPPYGEEKNTMSYTRFAKLSLFWLGYHHTSVLRQSKKSLGSYMTPIPLLSVTLHKLLTDLESRSSTRRKEVASFFNDYKKCLEQMYRALRSKRYCCIVIGNRTASGIDVPNDKITLELAEDIGFKHTVTFYREIPKKTLPRRGARVSLINRESIIILKKN